MMDQVQVVYSSSFGATLQPLVAVGTKVSPTGGFDVQRAGAVSYAAVTGGLYKASTLGGSYTSFKTFAAGNPVCAIIPYYRRNSTSSNTAVSDPDVLVALDASDGTGSLKWINGTTGAMTDITPTPGVVFDNANCVTTSYGTNIACFGKIGGAYHLYISTNGGTSWTDKGSITSPAFIRGRRNDNRAGAGGLHGQLYIAQGANNGAMSYSSTWGSANYYRAVPVGDIDGFDVLG